MGQSIRVLHVDDDPKLADLAATYLERNTDRLEVDCVYSPADCLDELDGTVDCVVSDYDMPRSTGIELLEAVREDYPDLPFILFTGKGSEEIASEAISAGVSDYLQKGSDPSQFTLLENRITNIVERERSRHAVAKTERKLSELAEKTEDVLFMFDGDWSEVLFVNSRYEDIWGRDIAVLQHNPQAFLEGVHREDRQNVERVMETLSNGDPADVTFRVVQPDGGTRWVEGQGKPISEDGEVVRIVGYVRDVTAQKRRERELARERDRFERLFRNVPNPVAYGVGIDGEPVIEAVNPAFETVFGYDSAAIEGEALTDLIVPPSEHEEALQINRQAVSEGTVRREVHRETVDGIRDFQIQVSIDTDRDPPRGYAIYTDITDRKEREQRLGEVANIVSHDLRNTLHVARNRLEIARENCDWDALEAVDATHERMEALITDLLALAREDETGGETESVTLGDLSKNCWDSVDTGGGSLETDTDTTVKADRQRFSQLLENLFRTATQHGGDGVTVTVGELDDGVGFFVADDGAGIDVAELETFFESGYSTAEGTGLGLAIVRQIAHDLGWSVAVTESDAGGARFEVRTEY